MNYDQDLQNYFEADTPETVIAWALQQWGSRLGFCTSFQAEGMVLIDMASKVKADIRVFTLDTGRLHQETYAFMDQVRKHYGIDIQVYFPDLLQVESMVSTQGANLFYDSVASRTTCCNVRKVAPLRRALEGLDAWVVGLRRDQGESRRGVKKVEKDYDHGGLVKISPLADWTRDEVWSYIKTHNVPQHPLYAQGYTSIGCAPCTRAIQPGEDIRAGRWWWEATTHKECGLHYAPETGSYGRQLELLVEKRAS